MMFLTAIIAYFILSGAVHVLCAWFDNKLIEHKVRDITLEMHSAKTLEIDTNNYATR